LATAALTIAGVLSSSGLAAVLMKKLGRKNGAGKAIQKLNPKEETWEK
jgi:hypothetical protein